MPTLLPKAAPPNRMFPAKQKGTDWECGSQKHCVERFLAAVFMLVLSDSLPTGGKEKQAISVVQMDSISMCVSGQPWEMHVLCTRYTLRSRQKGGLGAQGRVERMIFSWDFPPPGSRSSQSVPCHHRDI